MCEAHVYVLKDGKEEKVLESVDELVVQGEEIKMVNIFGEQKMLKAKVLSYSNPERKILLMPLE